MQKSLRNEDMIEKGTGLCHSVTEANKSWPFRLKLTTDHIRWDSLKISPSQEFDDHILKKLDEASRKVLDAWIPIEIHIIDTDIQETYRVKLAKKKSFWFEPLPDVKQKKKNTFSFHRDKARNEYYYSLEPFKHIVKRRNLSCDKEIALCWSGNRTIIKFDFSVVYSPRLELHNISILEDDQEKQRIHGANNLYLKKPYQMDSLIKIQYFTLIFCICTCVSVASNWRIVNDEFSMVMTN